MLKTKTERVLLLAIAFLAGCEASRLANVAVPPANAEEPAERWAYACFQDSTPETLTSRANKFGAHGWELASSAGSPSAGLVWCFKRSYVAAAAPPASAQ
jgi:hypothetical protein